jgi:hypothetical protein
MDMDVAMALKIETIDTFVKALYTNNKTINVGDIIKTFDPTYELTCDMLRKSSDNGAIIDFPNMNFDPDCLGDVKYPVSLEIMIPTAPKGTWMNGTANQAGIILDSVQTRIMRTDTNQVV